MAKDDASQLLAEYERRRPAFDRSTQRLEQLVRELVQAANIRVHSVASRAKKVESLRAKLAENPEGYSSLAELTDLCGVRVITYFADEVDQVARVIDDEFIVDADASVDRRAVLDPERFGYASLHYVVSLSPERARLPEYSECAGVKAEVQIRTILQHTWAEIEHDLGYKTSVEVPSSVRRRFSRLSGLLELADQEFGGIRGELEVYGKSIAGLVQSSPSEVLLDGDSMGAFVRTSDLVQRYDQTIADQNVGELRGYPPLSHTHVSRFRHFGYESVKDVADALLRYGPAVVGFASGWLGGRQLGAVSHGISLFYLGYVLAAASGRVGEVKAYLDASRIESAEKREGVAAEVLETYERVKDDP